MDTHLIPAQRAYTKKDQRFVREAVWGRVNDTQHMVDNGVRFVRAMIDAGADPNFIDDTARGLHDVATKLLAGMRRDLDDAYLPIEAADIELTELEQLITTLERAR